jgi:hypothetical protein
MARQRKSKNDITKYVIIGIVVLVLLFLVMNVDPTGKSYDAPGQKELNEVEFRSGEETEEQGEISEEEIHKNELSEEEPSEEPQEPQVTDFTNSF